MRFFHRNPEHSVFGLSAGARFFSEEDGNAAGDSPAPAATEPSGDLQAFEPGDGLPPSRPAAPQERLEGETLPDFGSLGRKPAASTGAPKPAATPEKPAEAPKPPAKPEKPPGGQPEAKVTPAKPQAKPITTPEKVVEPPKPADKPAEKPTGKEKTEEAPKPGEQPKPEDKKEAPKLPSDAEIEAMQPKPGSPNHVFADYKAIKAKMKEIVGTARQVQEQSTAEVEKLRADLETAKKSGGMTEEQQKEFEQYRNFHLLFRTQENPKFKAEFEAPITKAEESVYSFLKANGLADTVIDEIKAAAKENGGNLEAWPRWNDLVQAFKNPVDQQELLGALKGRRDAIAARETRLQEIAGDREKYNELVGNMDAEERQKFGQAVSQATIPLAEANPWIIDQDIPADATPEQKAAIEAANVKAKERAETFAENVRAAYGRDAEKVAQVALDAVKAGYLEEQNQALTAERDKLAARVAELEARASKVKSAGRMAHVESPVPAADNGRKTTVEEGKIGGDGASAIHDFFNRKSA